ncbi:MAG: MmgE/PrpD family protein [Gammaproteobacteria bacterium]|nr:MmgE/PrpD family protein [Gammaproteobacteria bacterium]
MMQQTLTQTVADWLIAERSLDLPDAVAEFTRLLVMDWLGSALAGGETPVGTALAAYTRVQPVGPCTLAGMGMVASAEVAALVNGALSHIVEMDDLDRGSVIHPGAVVIPAALAVAEREKSSAAECLHAIVCGYEIAIRVGEAVGKRHYFHFHNTATCGVFGAAAAAAQLLGLDRAQLVWALGNAGTQAAGLWEFNAEGAMSKHLHAGRAAANGVLAVDLAVAGVTGASAILEGPRGFFAGLAPEGEPDSVVEGLGTQPYRLMGTSIKPHASCRHTHPAIDAALLLREQVGADNLSQIAEVEVRTYQAALDLCDNPLPESEFEAKFSLQYCVASALARGSVALADFAQEVRSDPELRALVTRVEPVLDGEIERKYPRQWQVSVTVKMVGGQQYSQFVGQPRGDPENPLSPEEFADKFRMLAAYGDQQAHTERLLDWIDELGGAGVVDYSVIGCY